MKVLAWVLCFLSVSEVSAHFFQVEPSSKNPEAAVGTAGRTNEAEELIPNPLGVFLNEEERDVIRRVNQERKDRGLELVAPSLFHMKTARDWAKHMNDTNNLAHRAELPGSGWRFENIAAGKATPAATMTQWMNSKGHKANILHPRAKYIGVGHHAGNGYYTNYWVQNFSSEPE